jgi:Ca2+/Na+ antiporter
MRGKPHRILLGILLAAGLGAGMGGRRHLLVGALAGIACGLIFGSVAFFVVLGLGIAFFFNALQNRQTHGK